MAEDIHHGDMLRWLEQVIAAGLPCLTAQDTGFAEFQEDCFQEFIGYMPLFGDLMDRHGPLPIVFAKVGQGMDSILGFR